MRRDVCRWLLLLLLSLSLFIFCGLRGESWAAAGRNGGRAKPRPPRPHVIRVQIVDPEGNYLSGVKVGVSPAKPDGCRPRGSFGSMTSDEKGCVFISFTVAEHCQIVVFHLKMSLLGYYSRQRLIKQPAHRDSHVQIVMKPRG